MKNYHLVNILFFLGIIFPFTKSVQPSQNTVSVFGCDVSYYDMPPVGVNHNHVVLLLHGVKYDKQTWFDLGTLDALSQKGIRVVAVDLPGFGKSSHRRDRELDGDFILALVKNLGLVRPVLVAPSYSGKYAVPMILEHTNELAGFVPVASSNVKGIFPDFFAQLELRTLIVYGQNDFTAATDALILQSIPGSKTLVIPNAGHACYFESTFLFIEGLVDFVLGSR